MIPLTPPLSSPHPSCEANSPLHWAREGLWSRNYSSLILIAHHSHFSRPPSRSTQSETFVTPVTPTLAPWEGPPTSSTPNTQALAPLHMHCPLGFNWSDVPYCAHTQWQWRSPLWEWMRPGVFIRSRGWMGLSGIEDHNTERPGPPWRVKPPSVWHTLTLGLMKGL